jgi:hypothetical protein
MRRSTARTSRAAGRRRQLPEGQGPADASEADIGQIFWNNGTCSPAGITGPERSSISVTAAGGNAYGDSSLAGCLISGINATRYPVVPVTVQLASSNASSMGNPVPVTAYPEGPSSVFIARAFGPSGVQVNFALYPSS